MQDGVKLGEHSYIVGNLNMTFFGGDPVIEIGKYCSIAHNVTMNTDCGHYYKTVTTYPFYELMGIGKPNKTWKGKIIIGNDVWVGTGATIMPGVKVGDGAIVGAYSVVAKDVPPYAIVAGNPARIIKYRFSDEKINQLLAIKWWDWPDEEVREKVDWLCNDY